MVWEAGSNKFPLVGSGTSCYNEGMFELKIILHWSLAWNENYTLR
jgi:hypothetical protein